VEKAKPILPVKRAIMKGKNDFTEEKQNISERRKPVLKTHHE